MDNDTPKPIVDLLDSLSRHDEIVADNIVAPGLPLGLMLDFSDKQTQPLTETSYVLDLTQGELQPLEDLDEEELAKMDLDAIITAELDKLKELDSLKTTMTMVKSHIPPLLKLHTPKPSAHPKERVFLPPVSDEQVNSQKHKRYHS